VKIGQAFQKKKIAKFSFPLFSVLNTALGLRIKSKPAKRPRRIGMGNVGFSGKKDVAI